ncbi:MAG: hypothetical protein ACREAG_00950 [Nitrosopumilaceae archaeon]
MYKKSSIKAEKLVILGVLFVFYVVGDLMTTIWLINKHPAGILGEINPFGIMLYSGHGIFGLIIAKVLVFIAISLMALIIEFHWADNRNVILVSNFTILGLMAWSIVAVTVNVLIVYMLSLQQGTYESVFLLRLYVIIFFITLGGLILTPKFVPSSLGVVEVILAAVVILGPFVFSPSLYNFLVVQDIKNLIIYAVSNIGLISIMIYTMNKLYKHSLLARK